MQICTLTQTHNHTSISPIKALKIAWVSWHQKDKIILDLIKKEMMGGSGIS